MKLTKTHREQIVAAVMRDTPMRHKLSIGERTQAVVDKFITERGPRGIRHLWKDKEFGQYLSRTSRNAGYLRADPSCSYEYKLPQVSMLSGLDLDREAQVEIQQIADEHLEEMSQREDAESKLHAALAGIRTRKQFIEQFPELEKYAPEELTLDRTVPAICNVMATLSKLGFPADKEEAVAA